MTSSSRQAILDGIRRGLGRGPVDGADKAALEARMTAPKANLIPARAQIPHGEQVDLFVRMAEAVETTVDRVDGLDAVPGAVADYLAANNLPSEIRAAPDPALDAIPWQDRPLLTVEKGRAENADATSVTPAFAAVAESGTLVLHSGPDNPTTLNFMPENHIVVLKTSQVTGTYEEVWSRLRARDGGDGPAPMPRTVNMITGPSRTADIAQQLYMGAHGPRRLHIVLVDDGQE